MKVDSHSSSLRGVIQRGIVTIGNFDGVHIGHQVLLRRLKELARQMNGESVVLTFDPHPLKVLAPDRCPPLLQTRSQKLEILEKQGVDRVILYPFTRELSRMKADEFVREILVGELQMAAILVGEDFSFGYRRQGNVALLRELSATYGYRVLPIAEEVRGEEIVSSTRVREAVTTGEMEMAASLLGRQYQVCGEVIEGLKLGKKLGYPTANIRVENELLPPNGVYAVDFILGPRHIPGASSLGIRPTIDTGESPEKRTPLLEVHLLDFDDAIYGELCRVDFYQRVRPERQFNDIAELVAQMARDVEICREILSDRIPNRGGPVE